MIAADLDGFLERFLRWGAAPTVEGYVALFHADATLRDPGGDEPLTGPAIRRSIESVLAAMADFRLTPVRIGRSEDTVFVEATNTGTLAGNPLRWEAVYCIGVRGGHVARGRRYYDRAALYGPLLPTVVEEPRADAGAIHLEPGVVGHAPDGWFREWTGTVAMAGAARPFGVVERHAGGEHRWFFDRISLLPAAAALVEQIGVTR
ncbi:MAG: nuclear transport factor 2 family protein [Acidimicrobiales bacterium]